MWEGGREWEGTAVAPTLPPKKQLWEGTTRLVLFHYFNEEQKSNKTTYKCAILCDFSEV